MVKGALKWARRLAVLATVVAIVRRLLDPGSRTGQAGSGPAPTIGGDTWPPVPTNPGPRE